VHGNQLVLFRCVACQTFVVVRVNSADLDAHNGGVYVQRAFPYLEPAERELFLTSVCSACWVVLCPDPIKYPDHYN
jgi:hypothetical protein